MLIHKLFQASEEGGEEVLRSEKHTNDQGNPVYEAEYDADGELTSVRRLKYNDQHRMIEEVIEGPDDVVYETHYFEYNSDGKLSIEKVKYADGSQSRGVYEYEDGLTRVSWYNEDEVLEQVEETSEDAEGRVLYSLVKDGEGTVSEKNEYVRDAEGRPVSMVIYEEAYGERAISYEYAENKENGTRARVVKDHNGYVVMAVFEALDEHGRVVEEVREEPSKGIKHTHSFEYDDAGRLIAHEVVNDKGRTVQEHSMEYDDKGRVLKEEMFVQPGITLLSRHEYTEQ